MKRTTRTQLTEERKRQGWSQKELANRLGTTQHNISRWEAGQTTPGPYFRAKLCALFGKSAQALGLVDVNSAPQDIFKKESVTAGHMHGSDANISALWTVPYGRNPQFIGRDEILAQLDQQFFPQERLDVALLRRVALTQPQALRGLGGIGKTQIAVEYAYRSYEQGRYTHVLWINAASEEALLSSFMTLADLLPAEGAKGETDQRKLVEAIKGWLEQCQQPWLAIFDNADEISLLQPYLPQRGNGSLLLTTRAHAVGSLAASIEVENMGLVEGTTFLLQRAQRLRAEEEERDEATNIVIALDGFPLALDQAGAYIEETGCSFWDYLQAYQEHQQALLARRGKQATHYPDSVATTWLLSFEKIAASNPTAIELLHLCAFLAPDAIPEELFTEGAAFWSPVLQSAVADRLTFHHLLEDLLRFSLLKRRAENRTLSLHRLVQVVQRDMMGAEMQRQWAERVVRAVQAIFPADPKGDVTSWPQCLRFLEQAQACYTLIQQYQLLSPEAAALLERTGIYLREQAFYALAEPLFQWALHLREAQGGPDDPRLLATLTHLAELYWKQGKHEQAHSLYHRALALCERHFGSDHLQTAVALNGLANLAFDQGTYAQAASLYYQALTIREQHLGPEHPQVLFPLNGLADTYREMGKYVEAEPLFLRALRLREQHLGPEHPNLAHPLSNLGILYTSLGKYAEAEPLFLRALRIWEQHLGLEHPQLAYPLNGLAKLYAVQGKYTEAEPFFRRALQIREQQLGPDHPEVAHPLNNLGTLYLDQGKYEQAEPLYQRALAIWELQLGVNHVQVAYPLGNLAELYYKQGKYEQAEPLFQRALWIWEQYLGLEHPSVAYVCNGLATLYREQGRYAEAGPLYQRALSIRERILGEHHLETAETLADFAVLQEALKKYQEAVALYHRAYSIREQVLGPEHPEVATALAGLGRLLARENEESAKGVLRQALAIREQHLGPEHPETAHTLHDLATIFQQQGKLCEALSLAERALQIREQALGDTHPKTVATRTLYAQLREQQGDTAEC